MVRKIKRALGWMWGPGMGVFLPVWNVGWLVFNAKHWLADDGSLGVLLFGFWLVICLYTFYAWGRNREHAKATKVISLAAMTIKLQEQALQERTPLKVRTVGEGESKEIQIFLGPISMN